MKRGLGAGLVAALAFLLYWATLLPGLDFGDTPSFQIMAGAPVVTPRDGYPLYFAIGRLFVLVTAADWAHALNLASAVEAAIACGILVLLATEVSGSLAAGMAAACLFGGSYTFWSQAVLAEVYALHIAFVALSLLLLLRWDRRPTLGRLAVFFAIYALAFGNHLTMILLAPAYALFIVLRPGWRTVLTGRVFALAAACAVAGAMQYAWNLHALWLAPLPPQDLTEGIRQFWFDVTKSDWRDSMVLRVPTSMTTERLRMYGFEIWQQFGWLGPILAAAGVVQLWRTAPARVGLLGLIGFVTAFFALSYNVGDTHVFLLPSHLIIALLAAPGIVCIAELLPARQPKTLVVSIVSIVVTAVGMARIYDDYPALDRSQDLRPTELLEALTVNLDDRHGVLLTDLNWQIENGLHYFVNRTRNNVAVARMNDVLPYAPVLIRDNLAINRQVFVTERAAATLQAAYGSALTLVPDPEISSTLISDLVRDLPLGTRYVVCVLSPPSGTTLNNADIQDSLEMLSGARIHAFPSGDYAAMAGLVGEPPALVQSGERPFRADVTLAGVRVTVRMDAWLAFDTIRRMGFGHVVSDRKHSLIVERGVSFVAFDATGQPIRRGYAGGLFAPQPRFVVRLGAEG